MRAVKERVNCRVKKNLDEKVHNAWVQCLVERLCTMDGEKRLKAEAFLDALMQSAESAVEEIKK